MRRALLTALGALLIGGCGGGAASPPASSRAAPGAGGSATWLLGERPIQLDPLFATSDSERLVSRQVHEPLIERLSGPFEDGRRLPGPVVRARPSADFSIWRLRLRAGVRFQDGSPLNAQAVLANVARWQALPELSGLPAQPELLVDSPKPDLVRFILAEPDRRLDRRLARAQLGVVAPASIERAGGGELALVQLSESGIGPFELRERSAERLLLARNSDWWGSRRGLGPALDQLEFEVVSSARERVARLDEGSAEVATQLPSAVRGLIRRSPLLAIVSEAGGELTAAERSVRGISKASTAPSLNSLWLTRIDGGS